MEDLLKMSFIYSIFIKYLSMLQEFIYKVSLMKSNEQFTQKYHNQYYSYNVFMGNIYFYLLFCYFVIAAQLMT